jgi:hypothetical protein
MILFEVKVSVANDVLRGSVRGMKTTYPKAHAPSTRARQPSAYFADVGVRLEDCEHA